MERRTRIWIGLGTSLLVGGTMTGHAADAREAAPSDRLSKNSKLASPVPAGERWIVAQAEASGEGGPGEGGGPILGTITEFRLSTSDPTAFSYSAASQVSAYAELVTTSYDAAHAAARSLQAAIEALRQAPSPQSLAAARSAWLAAQAAYLRSEAFLFYSGPIDGPDGPLPRLAAWPVETDLVDRLLSDKAQPLDFRALARLNRTEPPVSIATGLHVVEYLLWGSDGRLAPDAFAGEAGTRRGQYVASAAQLLVLDLGVVAAAWSPGANNYRASILAMDQRNALGRAFNGMTVLVGYELPLRRIGAGLFPANQNFQSSPFSRSSAADLRNTFEGAKRVYFETGIDRLLAQADDALRGKVAAGFARADAAVAAMDAPYERFLAPPAGSADRTTAEAAVRALTDLARDLRQAGNRLGVLVVVPGM